MSNPGVLPSLVKDQTKTVLVPEEWTALPAIKGRPTFQVGALNNLTMDLMVLQVKQTRKDIWLITCFLE